MYKEFCFSQGYTSSPHQLDWAHKAKDHHRTYDELSRFTDGCMDELLRRYVVSCASDCAPTAGDFVINFEHLRLLSSSTMINYVFLLRIPRFNSKCVPLTIWHNYGILTCHILEQNQNIHGESTRNNICT